MECKNWADPVGKPEVNEFDKKVADAGCHVGILFAQKGISGGADWDDARGRVSWAAAKGRALLILTDEHLHQLAYGRVSGSVDAVNLFDLLEEAYRAVWTIGA